MGAVGLTRSELYDCARAWKQGVAVVKHGESYPFTQSYQVVHCFTIKFV